MARYGFPNISLANGKVFFLAQKLPDRMLAGAI